MENGGEVRLLLDTNIFLEIILDQARAEEAKTVLLKCDSHDLYMTDFTFHSIGILLFRKKHHEAFKRFLNDMVVNVGIAILSLAADEFEPVVEAARKFNLDFDDAYQYGVASKYDLALVSFDKDFDSTERGRMEPANL